MCVRIDVCHLSGPAGYSVGVGGVMMCLCSWACANPRSRHLYNSICLATKSGRAPAKTLAKRQGERGGKTDAAGCDGARTNIGAAFKPPSLSQLSFISPVFYYSVAQRQSLNFNNRR